MDSKSWTFKSYVPNWHENRIPTNTHTHTESVPEEEFDVDHSRSDFLYHVGYEVELVTRTGSMWRTYTGKKNYVF